MTSRTASGGDVRTRSGQRFWICALSAIILLSFSRPVFSEEVTLSPDRVLVDGRPFFIKAVAYSISYPGKKTFEEIPFKVFEDDFRTIKEAGFNTIRTYEPLPESLLDLAEKEGLRVIEGVVRLDGSTDFGSPEELERLCQEAVRIIRRDKGRSCILMWSIWNDAPFHWEAGGNVIPRWGFKRVNDFLRTVYNAAKNEDPDHPITASNVINAPGFQVGFDFLDVIGVNIYLGITDWSTGMFSDKHALEGVRLLERLSADYKKPVYVSEMGLSTATGLSDQSDAITAQIKLVGRKLSGFTIFEWRDEWHKAGLPDRDEGDIEEHWGLVDAQGNPKQALGQITGLLSQIGDFSGGYGGTYHPAAVSDTFVVADRNDDPKTIVENFTYRETKELLHEYSDRWQSRASVSLDLSDRKGDPVLHVIFSPTDSGAWAQFHHYFDSPIAFDGQHLCFWLKADGPVNFSIMLIDVDNERYQTPPLLTERDEWSFYSIPYSALLRDRYDSRYNPADDGSDGKLSLSSIKGIALKINDIPNFEQLFKPVHVYLDKIGYE